MKTKIIFADAHHAQGRLVGTLIRYEGKPVIVRDVVPHKGSFVIEAYYASDEKRFSDVIENFDLTPVPLGNIVVGNRFGYFTRTPDRRWKQGLTRDSMQGNDMPWEVDRPGLQSVGLINAIIGKYPTFDNAYRDVEANKAKALPFDRNFGLGRNNQGLILLLHRGLEVGLIDNDIFIDRKFFYLQEDLLRVLNK